MRTWKLQERTAERSWKTGQIATAMGRVRQAWHADHEQNP
jgi:hypothetical protein